jgi:hypothetical protein
MIPDNKRKFAPGAMVQPMTNQPTTSSGGVAQYANLASFPVTGDLTILYIAQNTNLTYRWTGSAYVLVGDGTGTVSPEVTRMVAVTTRNASAGNTFDPQTSRNNIFTMNGNLAGLQPTANGTYHGQPLIISFKQVAGGNTASYGTNFEFTTDVGTPVLSGGANVVDDLFCTWNSITSKWRAQSFNRGA